MVNRKVGCSKPTIFLLAPGLLSAGPTVGEGRFHPFCRSRSHLEEADDTGTPPAVIEAGFVRKSLNTRLLRMNPASITAGVVPVSSASSRWDRLRQNGFRCAMLGSCVRSSCVRIPLRSRLEGSQCHPPPQGGIGCGKMVFDVLC